MIRLMVDCGRRAHERVVKEALSGTYGHGPNERSRSGFLCSSGERGGGTWFFGERVKGVEAISHENKISSEFERCSEPMDRRGRVECDCPDRRNQWE